MKKQKEVFKSGNEMAAQAAIDINYDVMGYYPISPSTEIAQNIDLQRVNGKHNIKLIPADGEHSSAGICYGAATAGARVFNATSANGLSFMLEQLPVFSGTRYPMVMNLVNRAVSGPLNIHCDHSDLYLTLNLGWIILNASSPQEVYDQNIMALKLAEKPNVMLPAFISFDGYITSHQKHDVEIFDDENDVREFVGPKELTKDKYIYDLKNPITIGSHMVQEDLINNKYQLDQAMSNVLEEYENITKEYEKISGRKYDLVQSYKMEDAEIAIFLINSTSKTAKLAVDELRNKGIRAGVISPNILRPFPKDAIAKELKNVKKLIVGERSDSPGNEHSVIFGDILNTIKSSDLNIQTQNIIYGLGGNELFYEDIVKIFENALEKMSNKKIFYGVKKGESSETDKLINREFEYDSSAFKVGGFNYDYDENTHKLTVKVPPLRNLMKKPRRITGGHSACPGCGIFPGVEQFLKGIEGDVVMVNQTGCAYVVTANYPYSAHKGHYIHNLFQNGASTLSGIVEAIYELKKYGKIQFEDDATFVMLSGDGGMDIGMGSAIGAALRNHKMIILEYDNEGYMNTGAQLSYTTPIGHRTSTSNIGTKYVGKLFDHKDTVQIMSGTNIPYLFTGVDAYPQDLVRKAAKAQWYAQNFGLVYGKILIACPLNWKSKEEEGSEILQKAVNSNFFPLYEIEQGVTNITYNPEEKGDKIGVEEWLQTMGKSRHLLKEENKELLEHFKNVVDHRWETLKQKHDNEYL